MMFFSRRPEFVTVAEASMAEAKRLVARCGEAGISARLGGKDCCASGGCSPKAAVMVAQEDVPKVQALLQKEWHDSLVREGADPEILRKLQAAAENPSDDPVCPACGTCAPLVRGACSDCGLVLG